MSQISQVHWQIVANPPDETLIFRYNCQTQTVRMRGSTWNRIVTTLILLNFKVTLRDSLLPRLWVVVPKFGGSDNSELLSLLSRYDYNSIPWQHRITSTFLYCWLPVNFEFTESPHSSKFLAWVWYPQSWYMYGHTTATVHGPNLKDYY